MAGSLVQRIVWGVERLVLEAKSTSDSQLVITLMNKVGVVDNLNKPLSWTGEK
jgi:hypothetical protein